MPGLNEESIVHSSDPFAAPECDAVELRIRLDVRLLEAREVKSTRLQMGEKMTAGEPREAGERDAGNIRSSPAWALTKGFSVSVMGFDISSVR